MGCLYRICGKTKFNIDKFEIGWKIKPIVIHRKGDIATNSIRGKKKIGKSQLIFKVSDKSDLNGQILDAIKFLKKNSKYLENICTDKSIDTFALDFSFDSRIDLKPVEVQNDYFPAELIRLAGRLNISIWLTQWASKKLYRNKNY